MNKNIDDQEEDEGDDELNEEMKEGDFNDEDENVKDEESVV